MLEGRPLPDGLAHDALAIETIGTVCSMAVAFMPSPPFLPLDVYLGATRRALESIPVLGWLPANNRDQTQDFAYDAFGLDNSNRRNAWDR